MMIDTIQMLSSFFPIPERIRNDKVFENGKKAETIKSDSEISDNK